MKRARTLIIVILAFQVRILAQTTNSMDMRHSTGCGPFPIYLGMQWVHGSNQSALERLVNQAEERSGPNGGRVRLHGFEVTLGAIHNTESFLWIRGLPLRSVTMEVSYKYMARGFDALGDSRLRIREHFVAVRMGWRKVIYYPFTINVQAGPIIGQTVRAELVDEGDRILRGASTKRFPAIIGTDLRARMVFFDPAGAAGGFGFWVEGQFLYLPQRNNLTTLYAVTGATKDRQGSFHMGVMSLGITVPLALRLR